MILDATEALMREEGYAAVSSRRIAARAGLKSPLVHYHFKTMDDLFRALFRRAESVFVAKHLEVLTAESPLTAFWKFARDSGAVDLTSEMVAVANHRTELRDELARATERMRMIQDRIVSHAYSTLKAAPGEYPPHILSFLIMCVGRALTLERSLGVTAGHAEVISFMEDLLSRLQEEPVEGSSE
jgi:TetR/AcrR family transcriptional regulator